MKKALAILLVCITLFAFVSCSKEEKSTSATSSSAAPVESHVTLVYAEVNPLDSIVGRTASYFKEQVETLSEGSITIDLQASGVLGSENDVLDSMLGGGTSIDMSRISAFALTSYGAQKSMLLSIPFTFGETTISEATSLTAFSTRFRFFSIPPASPFMKSGIQVS